MLISDFRGLSVGMAPAYMLVAPRGAGEGDYNSPIILIFFSTSLKELHSDQNSECAGQMRLQGKSSGSPAPRTTDTPSCPPKSFQSCQVFILHPFISFLSKGMLEEVFCPQGSLLMALLNKNCNTEI